MTFTFLHTADWQIGKPFGSFPPDKAALLRDARLGVIDRLAAAARTQGAQHVLVAGDVFDSEHVPDGEITKALAKMRRADAVTWHLISGNHDPARPGGVWERAARAGLPGNVRLHLKPEPAAIADDVFLLPAPLTAKRMSLDPTEWMAGAVTPERALRIGIAHGSVQGFGGGDGDAEVMIAPGRVEAARLDYLALGDWHGMTRIGPRCWYSGTPEPDRFRENEPGFALAVRLQGAHSACTVEQVSTAHYSWRRSELAVADAAAVAAFVDALDRAQPGLERMLLRLVIKGQVSLQHYVAIVERLKALEPAAFHLALDLDGLSAAPAPEETVALGIDALGRVAELLQRRAAAGGSEAAAARLALLRLYGYAAKVPAGDGA